VATTLTPVTPGPPEPKSATTRRTPLGRLRLVGRRPDPGPTTSPGTSAPDQERRPVTLARAAAGALLLLAGLLVSFAGYLTVGSGLAANRAQDVMYQDLRTNLAEATVPVSGIIAPGTSLGVVSIPQLGLEQVFVEGSTSEQTAHGPGLKSDTVLPGQTGVSVLVGHRSTQGAAFAHLDQLRPGDTIEVTTGQGKFHYVVDLVRTSDAPATKVRVVPARLTLVTSDPAYTPDRTLMVSAVLKGKALPAATGTVATPAEQPGKGTSVGLVPLLLWSQLLLLVSVLATWAALRLPRAAVWLGAIPVLLAVLWHVFENLALLLPNTL
jgi:sortase A